LFALTVLIVGSLVTQAQTIESSSKVGKVPVKGGLVKFAFPGDLTDFGDLTFASYPNGVNSHEGVKVQIATNEDFTSPVDATIYQYQSDANHTTVIVLLPTTGYLTASAYIWAVNVNSHAHTVPLLFAVNGFGAPVLNPTQASLSGLFRMNFSEVGGFGANNGFELHSLPTVADSFMVGFVVYDLDPSTQNFAPQVNLKRATFNFNLPAEIAPLGKSFPGAYLLTVQIPGAIAEGVATVRVRACPLPQCQWSDTATINFAEQMPAAELREVGARRIVAQH
jgi:hypothetical protein